MGIKNFLYIIPALILLALFFVAGTTKAEASFIELDPSTYILHQPGGVCGGDACIQITDSYAFMQSVFSSATEPVNSVYGLRCTDESVIDAVNCLANGTGPTQTWAWLSSFNAYWGFYNPSQGDSTWYTLFNFSNSAGNKDCTVVDCVGFQFTATGGTVTINALPPPTTLTGVSRIVSFTPANATAANTSQEFTIQLESATPLLSEVCLYTRRVSDFQSFTPTTLCEPILSSGTVNWATTTTLTTDSSYLFRFELFQASSSQPYQTSETRYLTVGEIPYSSAVDFYNTGTTTEVRPEAFCDSVPTTFGLDWACRIVVGVVLFPGKAATAAVVTVQGTLQSIPPMSWYYQIEEAVTEIQYSDTQQQGILINVGFGQEVTFLAADQIDDYTGGNLDVLRLMTTTFIWLIYLMYLIRRVMTSII